jgi:hypothetical protein
MDFVRKFMTENETDHAGEHIRVREKLPDIEKK